MVFETGGEMLSFFLTSMVPGVLESGAQAEEVAVIGGRAGRV